MIVSVGHHDLVIVGHCHATWLGKLSLQNTKFAEFAVIDHLLSLDLSLRRIDDSRRGRRNGERCVWRREAWQRQIRRLREAAETTRQGRLTKEILAIGEIILKVEGREGRTSRDGGAGQGRGQRCQLRGKSCGSRPRNGWLLASSADITSPIPLRCNLYIAEL